MKNKRILTIYVQLFFVSILIFFYLFLIMFFYVNPANRKVSFVLLLGIGIVLFSFFLFFLSEPNKDVNSLFKFKFLSEDLLKLILLNLLIISLLIPSVETQKIIILWQKVDVLVYIKALFVIISCSFLPGANIYSIIFPKKNLHEKFKTESYILKLTLYPLLSFSFIGICVLIFDQIGFVRNLILLLLFVSIFLLFLLDIILNLLKKKPLNLKNITINVPKFEFIVLILAIGFIFISIGVFLGKLYLVPGDSWIGVAPVKYIDESNKSPITWGNKNANYPIFWSYIIYGYSVLGGLPYFNINAFLGPFCYLFVFTIYLFNKAIFFNYKNKYSILSTFLILLFSKIFHFSFDFFYGNSSGLITGDIFYYKSYAYLLFFFVLSLFIIISKTSSNIDLKFRIFYRTDQFKLIVLSSFFLFISFILYLIPLLMGLIFIVIYCIFSNQKKEIFQFLIYLQIFVIAFLIIFDIIMEFYLSSSLFFTILFLVQLNKSFGSFSLILKIILIYSLLFVVVLLMYFVKYLYFKFFQLKLNLYKKFITNFNKLVRYFLIIFTIFVIIEIFLITIMVFYSDNKLIEKITFFYLLNIIISSFGLTGILAIYLLKFSFKSSKKIFFVTIDWIIITLFLGVALMVFYVFQTNSFLFNKIKGKSEILMKLWFTRTWWYNSIPLSVLFTIAIFEITEKKNQIHFIKKIHISKIKCDIIKYLTIFFFVYLSFSNFFILEIIRGDNHERIDDEQVELFEWMSENIPIEKKFLIEEDYIIRVGIFSMVNGQYFFINKIFSIDNNNTDNINEMNKLDEDHIEYLLINKDFLEKSSNLRDFVIEYLIPNFYNKTLYRSHNYRLCYAPYFD